ncbi:MAG: pyruvate formate lyase-activating protein, partial [Clostridia bacterium]|nr:pyruvate formate lyase-activating protein [Clostridia bacterium]
SVQTMGTLDGPGIRFVVFTQGCNLRCGCCHNPDTWDRQGGTQYDAVELAERAMRYREYFGDQGGVTVSGGEPLLQAGFVKAFFEACHERGLNTCLDTSGSIFSDEIKALLSVTDRVLLDVKYPTDEQYRAYVGCGIETPLAFLDYLDEQGIATTLRQVIIPTLNDTEQNLAFLKELVAAHPCIDTVELLPFKKLCTVKYEQMGQAFRFAAYDEPARTLVDNMQKQIEAAMCR